MTTILIIIIIMHLIITAIIMQLFLIHFWTNSQHQHLICTDSKGCLLLTIRVPAPLSHQFTTVAHVMESLRRSSSESVPICRVTFPPAIQVHEKDALECKRIKFKERINKTFHSYSTHHLL